MEIAINWWAIVVSMVISVVLGFAWYGPLFGKQWMALSGIKMPEQKPAMSQMTKPIILSLIGALFMGYVLSMAISIGVSLGQAGVACGLAVAFTNWLGFVAPTTLSAVAWEGKSWKLWLIHNGYWLALLLIMGAIFAAWR